MRDAVHAEVAFLERRVVDLERRLREALACDGMPQGVRTNAIGALVGARRDRVHHAKLLKPHELRILDNYRALDNESRQMVLTLFSRLAVTSSSKVPIESGGEF